jgi:hypothetical protein
MDRTYLYIQIELKWNELAGKNFPVYLVRKEAEDEFLNCHLSRRTWERVN